MNQLPPEILGEIFSQLHQNDQMECMLVCHHWQQVIEEFVLYNTVYIYSQASLKKLIQKIQQRSEIASKIEQLILCARYYGMVGCYEDFTVEIHALLCLLHNVRTLSYEMPINEATYKNEIKDTAPYPWLKHIVKINENSSDSIVPYLLSSTLCPNLTTLIIANDKANQVIDHLKNAPALKILSMWFPTIDVSELELIHESLPHLNLMTFDHAKIKDFRYDKNIRPAISITECHFTNSEVTNFDSAINLLAYISKKYPNLSKLSFNVDTMWSSDDDTKRLVDYGWTPLVQRLGSHLKEICIDEVDLINTDFVEILDRSNCQISYLSLSVIPHSVLKKLAQSQQVFYIQTLALTSIDIEEYLWLWLREFKQLKTLKLSHSYCYSVAFSRSIMINDIIDNAPSTLRALYFSRIDLLLDLEYTGVSSIETLSLDYIDPPENFDVFLSRHFPRLSTLKLGMPEEESGSTFNLATLDLSSIYFKNFRRFDEYYYILVSTLSNNEQRWYLVDGRDNKPVAGEILDNLHSLHYVPYKTWSTIVSDCEPELTLICNSVKNVVFTE